MMAAMQYPERVRRGFSRAAATYDLHATLQREVLEETAALLLPLLVSEARILDAGCGTGYLAKRLKHPHCLIPPPEGGRSGGGDSLEGEVFKISFPQDTCSLGNHTPPFRKEKRNFTILQLDSAEGMCRTAAPFAVSICADMAALPLRDRSFEAVFSSLALQWMERPGDAFREFLRVTKPGGCAAIATLGPATLSELRDCFAQFGLLPSVMRFAPQAELIEAATASGWEVNTITSALKRQPYPSFTHLLHQLKGLGATFKERPHSLTPGRLKELQSLYERTYRSGESITATFEVITLLLRKPHE